MPLFSIYLFLSYSMKTWADVYIVYIVWLVDVDWMHLEVGLKWDCWLCADLLWIFKVKVSREIAQCSPCRTRTYATCDSGSNGPVSECPPPVSECPPPVSECPPSSIWMSANQYLNVRQPSIWMSAPSIWMSATSIWMSAPSIWMSATEIFWLSE